MRTDRPALRRRPRRHKTTPLSRPGPLPAMLESQSGVGRRRQAWPLPASSTEWARRSPALSRKAGRCARSSGQSKRSVFRDGGHHAAMALRAGRGHANRIRRAGHRRRDARAVRPRSRSQPAMSSASASTPATRCAATRSAGSRASAARLSSTAAFTRRCFPTKRREHGARPRGGHRRRRSCLANRARRLRGRRAAARSTTADASRATSSCRRAGICCRPTATCGARCRPCAAARSTARSVRCGGPTDRSRGSAASTAVVREIVAAAPPRLPLHRARRRQLLSGRAGRSRGGRAPRRTSTQLDELDGAPRRSGSS